MIEVAHLVQLTQDRLLKDGVQIEEFDFSVVRDSKVWRFDVAEVNRVTEDRLELVEKVEDGQRHGRVNAELRKSERAKSSPLV